MQHKLTQTSYLIIQPIESRKSFDITPGNSKTERIAQDLIFRMTTPSFLNDIMHVTRDFRQNYHFFNFWLFDYRSDGNLQLFANSVF